MSFAPFSVFRDLKLSALNDENRGKTPEKNNFKYVTDITL